MGKRKHPARLQTRRPPNRGLAQAIAALWFATIPCLAPTPVVSQAADDRSIETPRDPQDRNGNGIPDEYEVAPYTGFTVIRGTPPAGLVLSIHPQPARPGGLLNVAVLNAGSDRVQRIRVDPGIGTPLMIDAPSPANGLTLVPFSLPLGGDSLHVTVWLEDAVLARSVPIEHRPIEDHPGIGEFVYVEELPEALSKVAPDYPQEARRAGVSGTVMVMALIGKDGLVKDTRIQKSVPGLDGAAEACVRQWRFKAAQAHGEPVAIWVAVPVRFSLH